MPNLLFLSRKELESLLDLKGVIDVVKEGFISFHRGEAVVFPVVREFLPTYQGIFGIKSGFVKSKDYLGFKAGGYWKDNPKKGIPGHQSLVVLYSPESGIPQAGCMEQRGSRGRTFLPQRASRFHERNRNSPRF